jgi:membrane dipeptidase
LRRSVSLPVRRLAALLGLALGACASPPDTAGAEADRAGALAARLTIVDTHIDVPYRVYRTPQDVSTATATGNFDYPRAVAGGLDAVFMSIFIPASADAAGEAGTLADALIDGVERLAVAHPDRFALASCPDDVLAAASSGRIALALGMENGAPLAGDLARLVRYRDRGVAYITLTHSEPNHIADSSYATERRWRGLSPFGRELIPAMNDRGVIVDVSHISDEAFWQVLELARAPVMATHSSLRHFTPGFERNLADDMVRAIGANGGVVQVNFGSGFVTGPAQRYGAAQQAAFREFLTARQLTPDNAAFATFAAQYRAEHPYPYATVDDVLDHIDRVVELTSIDHVGIGSDFDGVGDTLPRGLEDVSKYPNLIAGLLRRGYGEADVEKILGGNALRVWREVGDYATARGHPPVCRL